MSIYDEANYMGVIVWVVLQMWVYAMLRMREYEDKDLYVLLLYYSNIVYGLYSLFLSSAIFELNWHILSEVGRYTKDMQASTP